MFQVELDATAPNDKHKWGCRHVCDPARFRCELKSSSQCLQTTLHHNDGTLGLELRQDCLRHTMLQALSRRHCQSYVHENCYSKNRPSPAWRSTPSTQFASAALKQANRRILRSCHNRRHIEGSTSDA